MKTQLTRILLGAALLSSHSSPQTAFGQAMPGVASLDLEVSNANAAKLRSRVVFIESTLKIDPEQPLLPDKATGYGVALSSRRIVALSFLVQGAQSIQVSGPQGSLPAQVILYDVERRVTILETAQDLKTIGLEAIQTAGPTAWEADAEVFALTSNLEGATVLSGVVLVDPDYPKFPGLLRTTLKLGAGMPIFDGKLDFLGYARTVTWDQDPLMFVGMPVINAAMTATRAAAQPRKKREKPPRPWWAK